jgi:hypothetical protein
MKIFLAPLLSILMLPNVTHAQSPVDSVQVKEKKENADDPSSFFTRLEVFNEFQHYESGINLNQTVIRTIIKIGKRFTTRVDIPLFYNSFNSPAGYEQFGLGDISFRLLGYKLFETKRAAFTASLEVQLNTAASPILGTGKNVLIPLLTYTKLLEGNRNLVSGTFQQVNSIGGDENRRDLSFSKIQAIFLHYWSKRLWTVVADELYIDYKNGGTSMILKGRMTGAPAPRLNVWLQGNVGLYGDFVGRYQWGTEVGLRYFLLRSMNFNNQKRAS